MANLLENKLEIIIAKYSLSAGMHVTQAQEWKHSTWHLHYMQKLISKGFTFFAYPTLLKPNHNLEFQSQNKI
jgi:hypothetical protein